MPKRTTAADSTPVRMVLITLDAHCLRAVERASDMLREELPGLRLTCHAASQWAGNPDALEACHADIAHADIIIVTMLFMEEHIRQVLPALEARRDHCDALVACMSAGEVIRLTRIGRFDMGREQTGVMSMLKRLRGSSDKQKSSGQKQLAMLRRLPRILRFIPGTAQDMRAYFLTMQYWLACSDENLANLARLLVSRYAGGKRAHLRERTQAAEPIEYPDVGLYHPRLGGRIAESRAELGRPRRDSRGTVGVLLMRSYILSGDHAHYDAVIAALEARGFDVVPAFASGLDARPAVERFFMSAGAASVDAVVSLTGFSLVGGPAYNDSSAAAETLAELDVPYLAAHALEFQTLGEWRESERGLLPVEATMMVAIPEIDGATAPMVYGGRAGGPEQRAHSQMQVAPEQADLLAGRVQRLVDLRKRAPAERRVAITLFNFPPNAGAVGSAAFLSVFESLHNCLRAMRDAGYEVAGLPETADELRELIVAGNAAEHGSDANVHARIPADDYVRAEPYLKEIEAQWGPAPGRQLSDGRHIQVLGRRFGNVLVGIQPAFGYEGDPMRLLFERGFAPTHAFSAYYRYLREEFAADAVLHFGTHGALEFMPGKQAGLSQACWPQRLLGDLPNLYLYAANNPSEGTLAKRRTAATLVSYLTPPITHAGLYSGLIELRQSIDRWRGLAPEDAQERELVGRLVQEQAAGLDLAEAEPAWPAAEAAERITALQAQVLELEYTLIPQGLHVVGEPVAAEQRIDLLVAIAEAGHERRLPREAAEALVAGEPNERVLALAGLAADDAAQAMVAALRRADALLAEDHEIDAILRALDGRFIAPVPGGDLLRSTEILPTGRNLHGFDPYRMPSAFAVRDGAAVAERLLQEHLGRDGALPESIAMVLWGTDNLKSEGAAIAQALWLLGGRPRFDSYGRLCGATLVPLAELDRPRIDVVMTLSGIFRDLLPLQTRMLAEAAWLAASADEPLEENFVRKHALEYQREHGCSLEDAALRVFSNADGAYGANVNQLIDSSSWTDGDELAEQYTQRKCFAYRPDGVAVRQPELLASALSHVQLAYQNLESVELGVTTIDHYFDTLGGISRAIHRARGGASVPVYIGDQTRSEGKVRTLSEQVALETRTRLLNPKWYEDMLNHGYEGVRSIEAQITNTVGWSATTGQVEPWVYEQVTRTFVLDDAMRQRLAELNPVASARVANRLLEAHEREYWNPDEQTLEALRQAGEDLEDRLEGVMEVAAA